VQPRVSWLKEASRGRLTRLSRKVEHTSLILALLYLVYTTHFTLSTVCILPKSNTVGAGCIQYQSKNMDNSYVWLVMSTSRSVTPCIEPQFKIIKLEIRHPLIRPSARLWRYPSDCNGASQECPRPTKRQ